MDCECKLHGKYKADLEGVQLRDNDFIFDPEKNISGVWKFAMWDEETCEILTVSTYKIISYNPRVSKMIRAKPGDEWLREVRKWVES